MTSVTSRAAIVAVCVVSAGCTKLFGIEEIPYATGDGGGSGDGNHADALVDVANGMVRLMVKVGSLPMGTAVDPQARVLGTVAGTNWIDCNVNGGPTCYVDFPVNTQITLDPMTISGGSSVFSVWDGACAGVSPNSPIFQFPRCNLTLTANTTVYAAFTGLGDYAFNLSPTMGSAKAMPGATAAYIRVPADMAGQSSCTAGMVCSFHYVNPPPSSQFQLIASSDTCATFAMFQGGGCETQPGGQCQTSWPFPQQAFYIDYTYNSTGQPGCP